MMNVNDENKKNKKNKTEMVLEHLQHRGSITTWEAIINYKATRLSDIVYRLRRKGYKIVTQNVERDGESPYARYYYVR